MAGIAALSTLLGVLEECVKAVCREDLKAYVFRAARGAVAIAWSGPDRKRPLTAVAGVRVCDIMGNEIPAHAAELNESPVYLLSPAPQPIIDALDASASQPP